MAITASNISVAQNPSDPQGGTLVTFTRSDTQAQVTINVSVPYTSQTTPQDIAEIRTAIQSWEAEENALAAVNSAASGQTV